MKIFLDANVLVATLNKEYPIFTYTSRIISLADKPKYTLFTSDLCLAIAFYFSAKKSGEQMAKKKIALLKKHLKLAIINDQVIEKAIQDSRVHDLEDGFQYYAAVKSKCTCIVTEDSNDFYFSDIEVLDSRTFLERYVF